MAEESPTPTPLKPDRFGAALGLLTFLAGVALLAWAFYLAYQIFTTPPQQALGLEKGKPIDVATTGGNLSGILIRTLLLTSMGLLGSWIALRGIGLYGAARGNPHSR
ncbi:MAG: hypothetical protein ACOYON_02030 [Fimbriimonas sp.]